MRFGFSRLMIFAGVVMLLLTGVARADAVVGQQSPALTATTLDGKRVDLSAFKGKVAVIHFWATWCAPCQQEMPALEAVWRRYHGQGLQVLAVSCDRPRARGDVDQVMHYFSFPAAMLDALGKNDFGTPSTIPVTYVIDKQGVVRNVLTPDTMSLTDPAFGDIIKNLVAAKVEAKAAAKTDDKTDDKK